MATISVIVPVYKVEPYLRRCIDSILGQTYSDFELILVNDGSPDNCPAICDEYAGRDSRVHVIHQENGGLSAARNTGIDWVFANSDSQWLTFVDSDDWIHPEMLERLLNVAVENNVAVSICGHIKTKGEEAKIQSNEMAPQIWKTEDFFVAHNINAIVAWGKLYQKQCFSEIRYPIGKLHEDEFTTYKILFQFRTIGAVFAPLYYYYENASGIMKSEWSPKRLDSIQAAEEQIQFFVDNAYWAAYRKAVSRYLWFITENYNQAKLSEHTSSALLKRLRKKMQQAIVKHGHKCQLSIKDYAWAYEVAFPQAMYCYWACRAARNKFFDKDRG